MRRFRRPMRAPIVTFKHQRNEDTSYLGAGANNQFNVWLGGAPGEQVTPLTVPAGRKVYSINVSLNFIHPSGSGTDVISWMLVHLRDGQLISTCFAATGASEWTNIGLSNCRNQVVKSFMALLGTEDSGPCSYNVHIKIPKIFQRVREGDIMAIVFNAVEPGPLSIGIRYKDFS